MPNGRIAVAVPVAAHHRARWDRLPVALEEREELVPPPSQLERGRAALNHRVQLRVAVQDHEARRAVTHEDANGPAVSTYQ